MGITSAKNRWRFEKKPCAGNIIPNNYRRRFIVLSSPISPTLVLLQMILLSTGK